MSHRWLRRGWLSIALMIVAMTGVIPAVAGALIQELVDVAELSQALSESRGLCRTEPVDILASEQGDGTPRGVLGPCSGAAHALRPEEAIDRPAVDEPACDAGDATAVCESADVTGRHPEGVRCLLHGEELLTGHNR